MEKIYETKVCNECGYPMMKLVKTEETPVGDLKTFLCPMCDSLQGEIQKKTPLSAKKKRA